MDEKNKDNETNNTVEGAGTTDTPTVENQNEGTSEETEQENQEAIEQKAQRLADGMLAKKMKGMPSKEELKAYRDWKEAQKTEDEKQAEKDAEYAKLTEENKMLKNEQKVYKAGIDNEYIDFVNYTVSKMEGDFEENLENFLRDNPKYLRKKDVKTTNETNGTAVKNAEIQNNGVKAILKAKHPELYD